MKQQGRRIRWLHLQRLIAGFYATCYAATAGLALRCLVGMWRGSIALMLNVSNAKAWEAVAKKWIFTSFLESLW